MARLVDIYKEIQETSDEKALETLSKEYEQLLEKSGMTNEELSEFVSINDELANKLDSSNKKITEQGNVIVDNVEALKELNETQRERIRLELEAQASALEANRGELLREQRDLQQEINDLSEKIPETKQKQAEQQEYINELQADFRKAIEQSNTLEVIYLANKIAKESQVSQKLLEQKATLDEQLSTAWEDLEITNQKLDSLGETYQRMIELELAQVGINAEK